MTSSASHEESLVVFHDGLGILVIAKVRIRLLKEIDIFTYVWDHLMGARMQ